MQARHGLSVVLDPGNITWEGQPSGARVSVVPVVSDMNVVGCVYGPVSQAEADAVVQNLRVGDDPRGPDVPWAAVAGSPTGFVAAASAMLPSGLFWSRNGGQLRVSTDPVGAAGPHPRIDAEWVRSYIGGVVSPTAAPFVGVGRIRGGETIRWGVTGAPKVSQWCGPQVWPEPHLLGEQALASFLDTFDAVLADLASRSGSVVCSVSAGLDSSFVAASLARMHTGSVPIRGLTYSPVRDAVIAPDPGVVADELDTAMGLAAAYPGSLSIEPVTNDDHLRPLTLAAGVGRRGGFPSFNPANEVWMQAMQSMAEDTAATMLFVGTNGNSAFSYDHPYAVGYCLRRGRVRDLAAMARDAQGQVGMATLRKRVIRPLLRRPAGARSNGPLWDLGVGSLRPVLGGDRAAYLEWLGRRVTGLPSASNPAAVRGLLVVDPFSARSVVEVAAAIHPAEWRVGGRSRAFARRAGRGRVPDAIRLGTKRGQQGRDAWFAIRHDRDSYLDRAARLRGLAGFEEVDVRGLLERVQAWNWGGDQPPDWREHVAVDRVLALGEFVEIW